VGEAPRVLDPELVHTDLGRVPVHPQQGCDHLTRLSWTSGPEEGSSSWYRDKLPVAVAQRLT
jgi:hypothetical protein